MKPAHPTWLEIIDATETALPNAESAVLTHARHCDTCRSLVTEAEAMLRAFADARLPAVPEDILERGLERIRLLDAPRTSTAAERAGDAAQVLDAWARSIGEQLVTLFATLTTDSLQAAPALRSAAGTAPRTMLYETPELTITLSVRAGGEPQSVALIGQLTPKASGTPIHGRAGARAGDVTREVDIDEYGQFSLEALPRHPIDVEIGIGSTLVRLAPITPPPDAPA